MDKLAKNMTAGQPEEPTQPGYNRHLNPRRKSRRYEGYQQAGWGWNSKVVNRMKNYGISYNQAYKEITKRLPDHKATAEEIQFTVDAFGSSYSPEELESSVSNLRNARHYGTPEERARQKKRTGWDLLGNSRK